MSKVAYPTVSVIVCTYNGGRGIDACLKGLTEQNYPKHQYSVVVVDDGCTDNTVAIAKSYGVKIVSHGSNLGVARARNTGFAAAAKSDIVAYLDDDCIASPHWLAELVAPFADAGVVAVGGRVVAHAKKHLAERYMEATGYGNPEPLTPIGGSTANPIRRLRVYLRNMYRPITVAPQPVEAQAVYTANVAYRTQALKSIGGFDSSLRSNEDSDVSTRLRASGGVLLFAPAAVVSHRHFQRVWHVIRQTFYRAGDTYQYYRKNRLLPPIFPFPLLYGLGSLGLLFASPLFAALSVVFAPVLLYNAWIIHAIRAKKLEYVGYAYIQLAREAATLLGFVRGAVALHSAKRIAGAYAIRSVGN